MSNMLQVEENRKLWYYHDMNFYVKPADCRPGAKGYYE